LGDWISEITKTPTLLAEGVLAAAERFRHSRRVAEKKEQQKQQ
jgi:hypothetical protein